MVKSESIANLAKALALAQGEMDSAKKNSSNPFFKGKYADLASVIDAIKEPLSKNGLSFCQVPHSDGDDHFIETILMHSSGEYIGGRMKLILSKKDMQALGSAMTYAGRYCISRLVGIAQDDDDGNQACEKEDGKQKLPPVVGKTEIRKIDNLMAQKNLLPFHVVSWLKEQFNMDDPHLCNLEQYGKLIQWILMHPGNPNER